MKILKKISLLILVILFTGGWIDLYSQEINYEESKIRPYTLPDPLITDNGEKISTVKEWREKQRMAIIRKYETEMYGIAPEKPRDMYFKTLSEDKKALNGTATRKEIAVYFSKKSDQYMTILLYLPNHVKGKVPVFTGLNFDGNATVCHDSGITLHSYYIRRKEGREQKEIIDYEARRGRDAESWQVEYILKNGYGLATVYYEDIDPDTDDFNNGIHALYKKPGEELKPEQWGSIAAWAWGLSRVMDYLITDKRIDNKKIALIGHSRLGKASMWAGAKDERFALVISNNSGCGGVSILRRNFGESIYWITRKFPHWYCKNFPEYINNENALPFDQHHLVSLIAPRPLYIASAEEDRWADQKGEFLAGRLANPVYALFGVKGMTVAEMPPMNTPIMDGYIAYHIRTGKHDVTLYDWEQYIRFADKFFKQKQTNKNNQ